MKLGDICFRQCLLQNICSVYWLILGSVLYPSFRHSYYCLCCIYIPDYLQMVFSQRKILCFLGFRLLCLVKGEC